MVHIGLGTAQYGMAYGATNRSGIPSAFELAEILQLARQGNVTLIDTVPSYGNSEELLGDLLPRDWPVKLVTKTLKAGDEPITEAMVARFRETALRSMVALGATWLEKHFTLDNAMEGPDYHFSVDPETMTAYIAAVRRTEAMLGDGVKAPIGPEHDIRIAGRRYLTTMIDIARGDVIDGTNMAPRRIDASKVDPAALLGSDQASRIVGWRASRDLKAGVAITFADVEPTR